VKNYILILLAFVLGRASFAQSDSAIVPPYKRFPSLPPIQILLSDSNTLYTKAEIPKNKPVLFIIFSPDCSHCQKETEGVLAHMDELKNVHIIMITYQPLQVMKEFIKTYRLSDYSNITVGRDLNYITMGFYNIRNIPAIAMYDKKGNLIDKREGEVPIDEIIEGLTGD
jgi:thioredoxin-related protein